MRISDWSSDVCSSGLVWRFGDVAMASGMNGLRTIGMATGGFASLSAVAALAAAAIGWRLARETEHGGTRSTGDRSEEHTSELQSLMRISYAVFCLKKKKTYEEHIENRIKQTTTLFHIAHAKTH